MDIHEQAELNNRVKPSLLDIERGFCINGIDAESLKKYRWKSVGTIEYSSLPPPAITDEQKVFFERQPALEIAANAAVASKHKQLKKQCLPALPAPHSYLYTKIELHPHSESLMERSKSVEQTKQMEHNVRKLLKDLEAVVYQKPSGSNGDTVPITSAVVESDRVIANINTRGASVLLNSDSTDDVYSNMMHAFETTNYQLLKRRKK